MAKKDPESRLAAETVRKYEADYVLYPWVAQKGLNPVIVDRAKGNYFWDASGKQYLDFTSMFVFSNLGHADPRVVAAIAKQAERLPTAASPFATEAKAELAKLLADVTPGDIKKTFFSTSGAEANEGAIKIARAAKGRPATFAGDLLGFSWQRGNPTDASGAFRPNPWASSRPLRPSQEDQTITEKGGREGFRVRFFKERNRAKDSNVEGLLPFIQRCINYCACGLSGGSRNPGKNWIPDQVRHDKPIRIHVAMYISPGNHG